MNGNGGSKDDGHFIHLWQPFKFRADDEYDYLRKGFFKTTAHYSLKSLVTPILKTYNKVVYGFEAEGLENIKALKGGAVVVCNHVHVLDCTMLACLFEDKRVYFLSLETNFRIPVARHLIRWLGAVPLSARPKQFKKVFSELDKALKAGNIVVIYPEGVLKPYDTELREFKPGAFILASYSGAPVLPIAITFHKPVGIYSVLKSKPLIKMTVLPPLYAQDGANLRENGIELTTRVKKALNEQIEKQSVTD